MTTVDTSAFFEDELALDYIMTAAQDYGIGARVRRAVDCDIRAETSL